LDQFLNPRQPHDSNLILDLDVFTTKPIGCDDAAVDKHLPTMRWIKDKVFFNLLTKDAVSRFQE
jgi:uncharacterized protein (TIGR04255 family)